MSTEAEHRTAVAELEAAQRRLGQTPRSDCDARGVFDTDAGRCERTP